MHFLTLVSHKPCFAKTNFREEIIFAVHGCQQVKGNESQTTRK